MTHEQRIAGFLAYLEECARKDPSNPDYPKRIAIVKNPHSGYHHPPLLPTQGSRFDATQEALADTERADWYSDKQEQQMRREANGS